MAAWFAEWKEHKEEPLEWQFEVLEHQPRVGLNFVFHLVCSPSDCHSP